MDFRKYNLENEGEVARLENQAKMFCYDPVKELEKINIQGTGKLLDAGCGSGIISRYLANRFETLELDACDISEQRLAQAQSLSKNNIEQRINYFQSSLENIRSNDEEYDVIVCRFVLEHLKDPQIVVNEFYRICKPEGEIIIIDLDGIFYNLYSANIHLRKYLKKIENGVDFDLFIGRKIPGLLKNSGFKEINYQVEAMYFKGDQLEYEYRNYIERFAFIHDRLVEVLGSSEEVEIFTSLYLEELLKPENTLFYNKFIVEAKKQS